MRELGFFVPSNRCTNKGNLRGLDGFNEIIAANRTGYRVGAKQERENLHHVMTFARAAMISLKFEPIETKAQVDITLIEPNERRDVSNVIAASKYILDALTRPRGKKPGVGLIVDDSPKWCEVNVSVQVKQGKAGAYITVREG